MSLSATIAIIVVADVALIALVAFVMSRASFLKPHAAVATQLSAERQARSIQAAPSRRAARRPIGVGLARIGARY